LEDKYAGNVHNPAVCADDRPASFGHCGSMTDRTAFATITTDRQITEDEHAFFEDQGFVKLRNAIDPEQLEYFGPRITEQVIQQNTQHLPLSERDTYGKAFLQVTNLWQHDPEVSAFVHSPDLARLAAELLGVESVRLYHDQALYKEPSGGITPLHADQYYWPLATDRCCTVWIPLQDTGPEMGPLTLYGRSHRYQEKDRDQPISDRSQQRLNEIVSEQGFPKDDSPFRLGDVSYHLGRIIHGAGPNLSTEPRRIMTIIYMDAEQHISEPQNPNQHKDLADWLGSLPVGAQVGGPLNPVLYPV
jgi:ectoine hydroxylase-related dioxygenase (phytanoyl-CoA dioxygenase family)